MRRLSKSKLIAFRQCKRRLWLEVNRPDLREDSDTTKAKFKEGNVVGEIAQRLYDPNGVGATINAQSEGYAEAFSRTRALLESNAPIFEAGFQIEGALAFADVMLPVATENGLSWRMVEVKSSTGVKPYHHDDIAIQGCIARMAGVNLEAIALAHIDSTWVYPGNQQYHGLLKEVDLTEEALTRDAEVADWIAQAQIVAAKPKEPLCSTGKHCFDPFECGFLAHCQSFEKQADYPVALLPGVQTKALKLALENDGLTELIDVPDELLNEVQLRVKTCTLQNTMFFDAKAANAALIQYEFPLAFMDFETVNLAVPIWPGTRPYQQVPFQYSVHSMDQKGLVGHQEFLDLSGNDPSRRFAETLIDACKDAKTIFVYSAGFENGRLKELGARFPDLERNLLDIVDRVVDLLPIVKNHYYHPDQKGSWSIKSVLPTIAPDLDYQDLDGVKDGGMAMEAFKEAVSSSTAADRKAEIERQLLGYCKLDTLAMIHLWRFLVGEKA